MAAYPSGPYDGRRGGAIMLLVSLLLAGCAGTTGTTGGVGGRSSPAVSAPPGGNASSSPPSAGTGCPAPGTTAGAGAPGAAAPVAGTYLGSGKDDSANAVDIGVGCVVVVGGVFGASGPLAGGRTLPGGAAGAVVRLAPDGTTVLSVTRVAGAVGDLEVRRTTGDIVAATDRGVRVLDPTGATVRWQTGSAVSRVAVGDAGTVAALSGTTVTVYRDGGQVASTIRLAGKTVNDVAVDDRTGLVYVTGFGQYGGPCKQVQIAFVRAYDRTGAQRWTAYDHPPDGIGDLCADSRGDRVAIGRDGKLYFAGETAGGNTIFSRAGRAIAERAPNVGYDKYTQAYNTSSAHLTYFARLDPATGTVLAGQMLVARLSSKGDRGNTIKPRAITADEQGRVYVGGVSASEIAGRSALTMNGRQLKPYAGGDPWTLVTTPDLRRRLLWTVWSDGGTGEVRGLAVANGVAAVAAGVDKPPFYLTRAVQQSSAGGYTAVLPARVG